MDQIDPPEDAHLDKRGFESNIEKVEKLIGFAEPILVEWARQINKRIRKKRQNEFREWKVAYEIFIPNFIGQPKRGAPTLEIILGEKHMSRHSGTTWTVLTSGGRSYGTKIPLDEISEAWFIDVLVKSYRDMVTTPIYFGWR